MAALFLGRRKDIKKAASGPITEQVSGEQHNCCSMIGNLQNLKKLQNIFYDGNPPFSEPNFSIDSNDIFNSILPKCWLAPIMNVGCDM